MLKKVLIFNLITIILVGTLLLVPFKKAEATWQSFLWETFNLEWGDWPWSIGGNPWRVIPTSGYQWGIVHEIYHYPFNDQSIWCAGMLNFNITNLTPFIDTYPPNLSTYVYWGPFSLVDAAEAVTNFWYWNDTEIYNDFLWWGASPSVMLNPLYEGGRVSGLNSSSQWQNEVMDFADLQNSGGDSVSMLGQPSVFMVFYFHSNGSIQHWGSFLDDISIGWNDGLFDLIALTPNLLDPDSNVVTSVFEAMEYFFRLQWEIEGEGTTGPFTIQCKVDEEEYYSEVLDFTVSGDTILYTYAPGLWSGDLGDHQVEWTLDLYNDVEETYEDNNYVLMPFNVVQFDSLPWIIVTRPTEGDTADSGFWIQWEDYDRESNAIIYLYYDTDSLGFNGAQINYTPIYEDTDPDSYWWNTVSKPNETDYFIYAMISDGYNPLQLDYSEYPLYIYHPSGCINRNAEIPEDFTFKGCYPNPFNSSASIVYSSPEAAEVDLTIYDVNGRLVQTLAKGEIARGVHTEVWNPDVGSGVYFCRIKLVGTTTGEVFNRTVKMLYLR